MIGARYACSQRVLPVEPSRATTTSSSPRRNMVTSDPPATSTEEYPSPSGRRHSCLGPASGQVRTIDADWIWKSLPGPPHCGHDTWADWARIGPHPETSVTTSGSANTTDRFIKRFSANLPAPIATTLLADDFRGGQQLVVRRKFAEAGEPFFSTFDVRSPHEAGAIDEELSLHLCEYRVHVAIVGRRRLKAVQLVQGRTGLRHGHRFGKLARGIDLDTADHLHQLARRLRSGHPVRPVGRQLR